MKFVKDEGSSFLHMVIVGMIFSIAIIVTIYIFSMGLTSTVKTQVENDLAVSNLSAATIDIDNYTENGKISLVEINKVYDNFIFTFTENMGLEEKNNNVFIPKADRYYYKIITNISVVNFYIYNIDGGNITRDSYDVANNSITRTNYINTEVYTPDGAKISDPTVYSKIEITLKLPGQIDKKVTRENSVAVVINK